MSWFRSLVIGALLSTGIFALVGLIAAAAAYAIRHPWAQDTILCLLLAALWGFAALFIALNLRLLKRP